MRNAPQLLPRYFCVLEENQQARYQHMKYIPVSFDHDESVDQLWQKHDAALQRYHVRDVQPKQSVFDLKVALAENIYSCCHFCERQCQLDRTKEVGFCRTQEPHIASEFLHLGEESVLVPSHTIFFSGCTFQCVFCQNYDISQRVCGQKFSPAAIASVIQQRFRAGARNTNWVGGDPTANLLFVLQVLQHLNSPIPQIWNSNMYCSLETMKLLDGIIDVYLTDFKYGNDACAQRLSKVNNYWSVITRNHTIAYEQAEMIIRHLVLPGHSECCSKPILDYISTNLPEAAVNVMAQYRPTYHAHKYRDIARPLSQHEFLKVHQYAEQFQLHLV